MTQVFPRRSAPYEQETDVIPSFANRHRLKWRVDDDGTKVIRGKFGEIYEYGEGHLTVMVIPTPQRKNYWGGTRNRLAKLGFEVVQDGDCEGAATFDPNNLHQSMAAIKAAGISRKRQLLPSQIDRQLQRLRSRRRKGTLSARKGRKPRAGPQPFARRESLPAAQSARPSELPTKGEDAANEASFHRTK